MDQHVAERTGFLFDGTLDEVDPATSQISAYEEARQVNKLIMIASESAAPPAVRQALASVFTDLYAEGYPATHTAHEPEDLVADVPYQLAYHDRYSDRRYYKGTEFADLVEVLAQERIRRLFAPNRYPHNASQLGPDAVQANVQPLSGANANTAVYFGLLQAGDTIMGLNLSHGGHLSHGSPVNISGKLFKVVDYGVDPATGHIDYEQVERVAREHNPRMIVSGASAYPWTIDFTRLRKICDALPRKAYLLADVSHPAGLVAAGLFPNPVGVADVTTFTTHKTLIGPRAAVILTTNESLARRIDRAVFPGLQGGPHMNTIAALAVAFEIALRPDFDELQRTIVKNARALADTLSERGLRIAYGGTETHLFLVDVKAVPTASGFHLNGDVAARILDLVGIVCNKNTIAGDTSAAFPSGVRFGTPWITQRGLTPDDMRVLGGIIADVFLSIQTFSYLDGDDSAVRGKIPVDTLKSAQAGLADLIARRAVGPTLPPEGVLPTSRPAADVAGRVLLDVYGRRSRAFLSEATTGDVWALAVGEAIETTLCDAAGSTIATLAVLRRGPDRFGMEHFACAVSPEAADDVKCWLESLSNGLVLFDPADPWAKVDGPVAVAPLLSPLSEGDSESLRRAIVAGPAAPSLSKPYFVGQTALSGKRPGSTRPVCAASGMSVAATDGTGTASTEMDRSPNGWTMPRSYGDPTAELAALRGAAGLIDEAGLGIFSVEGPDAERFLDLVTTNDVAFLGGNSAQYTFLLAPDGSIVADAILYRTGPDRFLLTTSPARKARVGEWLNQARSGHCSIDSKVPSRSLPANLQVRDLSVGAADSLTVIGLAGPSAPTILRALADGADDRRKVARLRRFTSTSAKLAGTTVLVARTGHTGQAQGYEIFVHPTAALALWEAAIARGQEHGVRPIGWDAWHAAGVAAGLPWDGHDLNGSYSISPVEAGYGAEVRAHKPFFIGRSAVLARPFPPANALARFRVDDPTIGMPDEGDPILDDNGRCVGWVTSASDVTGEPVGLFYGSRDVQTPGTRLNAILNGGSRPSLGQQLEPGAGRRVNVEVLPRFPK